MAPEYVFTRDYVDNNRINLQHYLFAETFGYRVHPSIPLGSPDMCIADVGTGTGIWLTDLAARLPSTVQLEGLDISFAATVPKPMLPTNMTLHQWNVREDVPPALIGRYDILHIRLFMWVLLDDEVPAILGKLVSMLKPGGYIQWTDFDLTTLHVGTASPDVDTSTVFHKQLAGITLAQDRRLTPTWMPQLAKFFSEAGLEHVQRDHKEPRSHLAMYIHECQLLLHELIARQARNTELLEKVQQLLPKVAEETRDGAHYAWAVITVVGMKPKEVAHGNI